MNRLRHIFVAVAVLVAAIAAFAPTPASATAPSDDNELALADIGGPVTSDIAFAPLTIDVPVVAGLRPTMVSGKLAVTGSIPNGAVMSVEEQEWSAPISTGDFNIPITNDQALSLVLETTLSDLATCDGGPLPRVVVSELSVRYDGTAIPPDHIGSFFPAALRKVFIVVPRYNAMATSSATLRIATALTRRYGRAPDIALATERPTNRAFSPFERVIMLEEAPEATIAIEGDTLFMAAAKEPLNALADRLDDPFIRTITTARFSAKSLPPRVDPPLRGDSFLVDTLRQSTRTSMSSTTLQLSIDAETFAKPPERISLKLSGRAVVTGLTQAAANVTIRVDGEAFQSDALDASGRFSTSLDISGFDQRRVATVAVEVAVSRTGCNGSVASIELDRKSFGKVSSHARPPTGFPGMMRRWKSKPVVGLNPSTLQFAATLLASIQEASPNPLHPSTLESAASSIIIGADLTGKAIGEAEAKASPLGQVDGVAGVTPDGTLVIRTSNPEATTRLLAAAKRLGWTGINGDLLVLEDDGSETASWQMSESASPTSRGSSSGGPGASLPIDAPAKKGLTPMYSALIGGAACVVLYGVRRVTSRGKR
jgi:hypothetical protein